MTLSRPSLKTSFKQTVRELVSSSSRVERVVNDLIYGSSGFNDDLETWNNEYTTGRWDYFELLDEMPRYLLCATYAQHIQPNPSILDVGCGYGTLVKYLSVFGYQSYVGIDFSTVAVERAQSVGFENAVFEVSPFETWESDRRFDVVIFCESLYHADSPVNLLVQYNKYLKADGAVVVSMFQQRNVKRIWKSIESKFDVIHSTRIINPKNKMSDVKILRLK